MERLFIGTGREIPPKLAADLTSIDILVPKGVFLRETTADPSPHEGKEAKVGQKSNTRECLPVIVKQEVSNCKVPHLINQ